MRRLILLAALIFGPLVSAHAQGTGDPVCAEYRKHWDQVSSGGDLAAMARAAGAISPACPALKAEVGGRLAEARRHSIEQERAALATASRQRATASAEQAARDQAARDEAARQRDKRAAIGAEQPQQEPSLAETFDFIALMINQQGKLSYSIRMHDSSNNTDDNSTHVMWLKNAEAGDCKIHAHVTQENNGVITTDKDNDTGFSAGKAVFIWTMNQYFQSIYPNRSINTDPLVYMVAMSISDKAYTPVGYFADLNSANRVANATRHAIELCAARYKSPF